MADQFFAKFKSILEPEVESTDAGEAPDAAGAGTVVPRGGCGDYCRRVLHFQLSFDYRMNENIMKLINNEAKPPADHYSSAVVHNGLVYLSGVLP